jgi:hypothetical protein
MLLLNYFVVVDGVTALLLLELERWLSARRVDMRRKTNMNSRAFPMMLCPPEAAEKVVFFGENDFNIFAPGVHLHGKCLSWPV